MNIRPEELTDLPEREDARKALNLLAKWAANASAAEISDLDPRIGNLLAEQGGTNHPALSRQYPKDFVVDEAYRLSLPDLQNGPAGLIRGAKTAIQHVGISNFRLPIRYMRRGAEPIQLETSVTGTVSLEADRKGINMSRIMRSFYRHAERDFSVDVIEHALDDYVSDLDSFDARIQLQFSYPMKIASLRSGLDGYQYYDFAVEVLRQGTMRKHIMHLDYVYSSTCPCSLELSEHARTERRQLATPHSQRSVARLSVELAPDAGLFWYEDLIELCRSAVPTETQVMVKREDEQAFAELNAANPMFVEDAVRLFYDALQRDKRVGDFRIAASHQESLHSHDAVSVMVHGETFAGASLDPNLFGTLIKRG